MKTTEQRPVEVGQIIEWEGDTWRVLALGVRIDGKVNAHLASTTRSRQQRNGFCPVQIVDMIPELIGKP